MAETPGGTQRRAIKNPFEFGRELTGAEAAASRVIAKNVELYRRLA
jgi:hypothetical protein